MLRPVVMSGPSGCGKSTLWGKLREEFPNSFGFSVSHTTRKPRAGEEDGKDYHFTTMDVMEEEISQGKFIEYAKFSGNMYGTSKESVETVLKNNRICLLDIDEQGVKNIKQTDLDALYIFIAPPSIEELRTRLTKRGTEKEEEIEKRMATAQSAIQFSETEGVYDIIIVNEDLDNAYKELKAFLLQHFPIMAFPNIAEVTKPIVEAVVSIDEGVEADIESTQKSADVTVAEISTEAAPENEVPNTPVDVPQVPATSSAPAEVTEAPATQEVQAEEPEAPATQEVQAEEPEAPATQEVQAEEPEAPATQEVQAEEPEAPATQEVQAASDVPTEAPATQESQAEVAEAPTTQEIQAEEAEAPATQEVQAVSDVPTEVTEAEATQEVQAASDVPIEVTEAEATQEVQAPATQEADETETPDPGASPPAEEPEIKEAAGDSAVEEIETNDTASLIAETSSKLPEEKTEINLEELSLSPAKIQLSRDEDEDMNAAVMTIDEEAGGDNSAIISERKSNNKHKQDESEHLVDTTQSSVVELEEEIKRESSAVCGAADGWCTIS